MAGTYTQIYIQIVFAVKYRRSLIRPEWEEELHKYICTIISNKGHKPLAVNGMPDHIHIFISMKPICNISELVREIKKSTTKFINTKGFTPHKFQWQGGFGAFSYSHDAVSNVINYILNQKAIHKRRAFEKEYMELLATYEVNFDEGYLFEWFE